LSVGLGHRNLVPSAANYSWIGHRNPDLSVQNLPALLVLGDSEAYLDAGPLRGGWSAYLPPRLRDSRAVLAVLRARLGSGAAHLSEADVPPRVLADKLEAFLRQHTYVATLTLNVINPGDASLVVDALVDLEARRIKDRQPELRFDVRLFTDAGHRAGIGDAFRATPLRPPRRRRRWTSARRVSRCCTAPTTSRPGC
jgi:hypothetical protein